MTPQAIDVVLRHLPIDIGSWQSEGTIAVPIRDLAVLRDAYAAVNCRRCGHPTYTHPEGHNPACTVVGCGCRGFAR